MSDQEQTSTRIVTEQEPEFEPEVEGEEGVRPQSEPETVVEEEEEEDDDDDVEEESEEVVNTETEPDPCLTIGTGPYSSISIIKDLPRDIKYSCYESYNEHIYLGTSDGELLHYFELEANNYLLVSRIEFDTTSKAPIDRILLLHKIERACVLSNNNLVLYLLPEFAPNPNTEKLSNINDVQMINGNDKIITFSDKLATVYKVSENGFIKIKEFPDINLVENALFIQKTLIVARQNNYEIIKLPSGNSTPLFKVSENDTNSVIKPIISEFGDDEILICSGGSTYNDGAMALVINLNGEISQGTIVLEKYPSDILVDYPHILVNFDYKKICIYKLVKNDEPQIIQTISCNGKISVRKSLKIFRDNYLDESSIDNRNQMIDKLRLTPLFSAETADLTTVEFRIEKEKAKLNGIIEQSTDIVICDNSTLSGLIKTPFFMEIKEYNESEISYIEDYLENLTKMITNTKAPLSKFQKIENQYLTLLHHLLILLHCKTISEDTIKIWYRDMNKIDIRILLYLFDMTIFGECWCPNGLNGFVKKLKMLRLINKFEPRENLLKILKRIRNHLVKNYTDDKEFIHFENVSKSIDIAIFKELRQDENSSIDINYFEITSLEAISNLIKGEHSERDRNLLLKIYEKKGFMNDAISLIKDEKDNKKLLYFIINHITSLSENYIADSLLDDLIFIINNHDIEGEDDSKLIDTNEIKDILKILTDTRTDYHKLLERVEDISLKVRILEEIGENSRNDKNFLINYYIQKLQETLVNDNLWDYFKSFIEEYQNDFNYLKINIWEYLLTKIKYKSKFEFFLEYYQNIINLCDKDTELEKKVYQGIQNLDKDNILSLLFFCMMDDGDDKGFLKHKFISADEMFNLFIKYCDFQQIDLRINESNFIQTLSWLANITKIPYSLELILIFLKRHKLMLEKDKGLIIQVFNNIPQESPITILFPFLFSLMRDQGIKSTDIDIHKSLLKSELNIYNNILRQLETHE